MTDSDQTLPQPSAPPCHVVRWRVATFACMILLAVAGATGVSMMEQFKAQMAHMQTKLKALPQVKYVSVLMDDKQQPAQLITFDPQDGYVLVQRLNDVKEGQEDSMQLWALDDQGRPLSLGVLPVRIKTAQIRVSDKVLSQAKGLAISVENKGGTIEPNQQPRLPYLFVGALIQKTM